MFPSSVQFLKIFLDKIKKREACSVSEHILTQQYGLPCKQLKEITVGSNRNEAHPASVSSAIVAHCEVHCQPEPQLVLTQTGSKQNLGHYVFNDGREGTVPPSPSLKKLRRNSPGSVSSVLLRVQNNFHIKTFIRMMFKY